MDLQLKDKRVLITGASRGIGAECARSFAREGARLVLASRTPEHLEALGTELEAAGLGKAELHPIDLSQRGAPERLAEATGEIDILVNNAGAIPGGGLAQVDEARWRESWELKLYGYINLVRAVLPAMAARKSGVIANIIGMAGAAPRAEYICGSTANAGLIAFTRAIGGSSPDDGVRVFGINPAGTRTDRIMGVARQWAQARFGDEERWQETLGSLPFGRLIEPQEVADLTVFCCSPRAGYLSGTVIDLDGGQVYATSRK